MSEKEPFKHLSSGSERRFIYELARFGARPFQPTKVTREGSVTVDWDYPEGLHNPFEGLTLSNGHHIEMPPFSAGLHQPGRRSNAIAMWLREGMLGDDEFSHIDLHARQRLQLKAQDMELALRELLSIPELEVRLGLFNDAARRATHNRYAGLLVVAVPPAHARTLQQEGMRHLESGAITEEIRLAEGSYRPAFRRPPRDVRADHAAKFAEPRHPHPLVHEVQRVPLLPAPRYPWTKPEDYPISLTSSLAQIARHQAAVGRIYTLDGSNVLGVLHHDADKADANVIMPLNIDPASLNMKHPATHAMGQWVDADYLGWIYAQAQVQSGLQAAADFSAAEAEQILKVMSAACTQTYGHPIYMRFCFQEDFNAPALFIYFADTHDQLTALQRFMVDMEHAERSAKLLGPERRWTDRSQDPENPSPPSPGR